MGLSNLPVMTTSSMKYFSLLFLLSLQVTKTEDLTCIDSSDTCSTKVDGVCDSDLGTAAKPGCETGDCFDCNKLGCGKFDDSRQGCFCAIGCLWCATDAKCYSNRWGVGNCTKPTDWQEPIEGTCSSENYFFR